MAEQRPKILLVDDEPFILTAVSTVLRAGGYDVLTCDMWAGVANMVRAEDPDVVLLDYNMPSLKGDNICVILKRNVPESDMKIVLFSSESERDLTRIAKQCGADGFIRKNTPAPELMDILEGYVRKVPAPR